MCLGEHKPLALFHLIERDALKHILCFTSSVDATHRLFLLCQIYIAKRKLSFNVVEYSGSLSGARRKQILEQFAAGKIHMFVRFHAFHLR